MLIDFGPEVDHYTTDITRTFPVNGKFTDRQAEIYDVVLAAQAAGIEYELIKVTDINEIMSFGVMMTPALTVDGEVKVVGKVPDPEAIRDMLL
ncbi:MAG: MTH895/ArsE family thioredoxin-like protein [Phycisphaerae bacterium]|nr:MTH895/ArsE family thioredoxin-like protein [Phycisphaerae bacterium]